MHITNDWIRGFVDGDGCFNIEKKRTREGTLLFRHRFLVSQDKRSKDVLYALKSAFKCGTVHKGGSNMFTFQIEDQESIKKKVIPFFEKYPLQTEKRKSFDCFAKSADASVALPNPGGNLEKREETFSFSINDGWFAGFVDAEGCFSVSIVKGYPRPQLVLGAPQKERPLLEALQTYLQCGRIRLRKDGFLIYQISSTKDFQDHIFPKLFTRSGSPLLRTIKRISSQKFRKIVILFLKKEHLTQFGMEKIIKLKANLNLVPS